MFVKFLLIFLMFIPMILIIYVFNLNGLVITEGFDEETLFLMTNFQHLSQIIFNVILALLISYIFNVLKNHSIFTASSPFDALKEAIKSKYKKDLTKFFLKSFSSKKRLFFFIQFEFTK